MRADILIGQHLAAGAEDADFDLIQRKDPIIPIGDIGQLADRTPSIVIVISSSIRQSIPGGRWNQIATSNMLRSAARIRPQAVTTVSVAVTAFGANGTTSWPRRSTLAA